MNPVQFIDALMETNHIQARAEYKAQLRQLVYAANQHDLKSFELKSIFQEIVGEIEELEDLEAFHNDD